MEITLLFYYHYDTQFMGFFVVVFAKKWKKKILENCFGSWKFDYCLKPNKIQLSLHTVRFFVFQTKSYFLDAIFIFFINLALYNTCDACNGKKPVFFCCWRKWFKFERVSCWTFFFDMFFMHRMDMHSTGFPMIKSNGFIEFRSAIEIMVQFILTNFLHTTSLITPFLVVYLTILSTIFTPRLSQFQVVQTWLLFDFFACVFGSTSLSRRVYYNFFFLRFGYPHSISDICRFCRRCKNNLRKFSFKANIWPSKINCKQKCHWFCSRCEVWTT